jgi:hypothetical protein
MRNCVDENGFDFDRRAINCLLKNSSYRQTSALSSLLPELPVEQYLQQCKIA